MSLGTQPAIVFVHGSGDTAHVWDAVIAQLPGWSCVALDLPGHGTKLEQPGPERMSIEEYAACVRDDLGQNNLTGICLVGHSLGSAIALRLAKDAPDLVSRLVLVGSGARLRVLPTILEAACDQGERTRQEVVAASFATGNSAERDAMLAEPAQLAPGMLYRDLAACDAFDMMSELGSIAQPALVVTGDEDRLTPPKYAHYLRDHLPNATLVLVPEAGHYLPVEAPEALAAAIRDWLRRA